MPSLTNAYRRISWGSKRLDELAVLHNSICAANAKTIEIDPNVSMPVPPGHFRRVGRVDVTKFSPIPEDISQLTGEISGHFRGALDYLVGQLSLLDTPDTPETAGKKRRTQFLIEDSESRFDGQRGTFLAGVNDGHVAALKTLQPCSGCHWTGLLRDISNMEKHNDLVMVGNDMRVHMEARPQPATDAGPGHIEVTMQFEPVLHIVLRDGPPLIESLQIIKSQITETLNAFNPEFQV